MVMTTMMMMVMMMIMVMMMSSSVEFYLSPELKLERGLELGEQLGTDIEFLSDVLIQCL